MEIKEKIKSALIAVFPTTATLHKFSDENENRDALQSLTALTAKHGLIAKPDKDAFLEFIDANANIDSRFSLPETLNFALFLEQKEKLLKLNLSLSAFADQINALLTMHDIILPKVTNTMLSRLKKEAADTSHKQNVLRSLAFWIGYERSDVAHQWNFESLLRVCSSITPGVQPESGVRVGFALSSRGGVIDHEILEWLKTTLENYIKQAMNHVVYGRWGKVLVQNIATLYVDFPKAGTVKSPASYRQSLRNAISLAYQIAMQWALTPYSGQNRFLAIGITAGEFTALDTYLVPILNTRLAGDPVIRMTDFARQCVLINDIRVTFGVNPEEITLLNGETLTIWWVVGVWTPLYFDFIPELLQDPLLGRNSKAFGPIYDYLYGIVNDDITSSEKSKANAIVTFLEAPHNSMLGIEIAKTLYYRQRHWDAIHILRVVLSLEPTQIHARVFLIKLFCGLAVEAPTQQVAEGFFKQAQDEARFILNNCTYHSEDFYSEYALFHLTRALTSLRWLRNQPRPVHEAGEFVFWKKAIFAGLSEADELSNRGMTISPLNIRASYLNNSTKIITCILAANENIFTDPNITVTGTPEMIEAVMLNYRWQSGVLRKDLHQDDLHKPMERVFRAIIQSHAAAVALPAYWPTTHFCTAVAWWDRFPVRTVGTARKTVDLLQNAKKMAEEMDQKDICIYSFTRVYGEILPAKEFIAHIQRSVEMVKTYCGKNLEARESHEILEPKDPQQPSLLMTLNF